MITLPAALVAIVALLVSYGPIISVLNGVYTAGHNIVTTVEDAKAWEAKKKTTAAPKPTITTKPHKLHKKKKPKPAVVVAKPIASSPSAYEQPPWSTAPVVVTSPPPKKVEEISASWWKWLLTDALMGGAVLALLLGLRELFKLWKNEKEVQ
jgi:hypothetical protein